MIHAYMYVHRTTGLREKMSKASKTSFYSLRVETLMQQSLKKINYEKYYATVHYKVSLILTCTLIII